jgi:hypothetical protein
MAGEGLNTVHCEPNVNPPAEWKPTRVQVMRGYAMEWLPVLHVLSALATIAACLRYVLS